LNDLHKKIQFTSASGGYVIYKILQMRGKKSMARIRQLKEHAEEEIEIGDQVKHPKFGLGTVLYKSGTGERAKAIVVFQEEGQKKLLLRHARLKRIKEAKPSEGKAEEISEAEIIAAIEGPSRPARKKEWPESKRKSRKREETLEPEAAEEEEAEEEESTVGELEEEEEGPESDEDFEEKEEEAKEE